MKHSSCETGLGSGSLGGLGQFCVRASHEVDPIVLRCITRHKNQHLHFLHPFVLVDNKAARSELKDAKSHDSSFLLAGLGGCDGKGRLPVGSYDQEWKIQPFVA